MSNPANRRLQRERVSWERDWTEGGEEGELEEHDETADEVGDAGILDEYAEKEDDARRREVEEDKYEDKPPERRNLRYKSDRGVNDRTENERRNDPEGDHVEEEFGREVGERVVVPVCSFAGEEEAFGGEGREGAEASEAEEGEGEENQPHAVLEAGNVEGETAEEDGTED